MTRRDIEAPIGRNAAWHVSIVCTSEEEKTNSELLSQIIKYHAQPTKPTTCVSYF